MLLAGCGNDRTPPPDTDLRGAKPFDDNFIGVMVPENQRAIEMARVEVVQGSNASLKTLARTIRNTQRREITAMNTHLISGSNTEAGVSRRGRHLR